MDIELGLEMEANTELKKENRLLKSLLYCTTRSCNNCGKVTCENFQRQRIDCCGNWVSYKDYIKQLEKENADLKEEINKIAFARGTLEEENAELKGLKDVATLIRENNDTVVTLMQLNNKLVSKSQQLTKAKEIIKGLLSFVDSLGNYSGGIFAKAEQFLSEVEK